MFVHIGGEVSIPTKQIIAIVDLETQASAESTQEFLSTAEDEGFVVHLTDKPNSFVVTESKVYLSPISALTLRKRAVEFARS